MTHHIRHICAAFWLLVLIWTVPAGAGDIGQKAEEAGEYFNPKPCWNVWRTRKEILADGKNVRSC